MKAIIEDYGGAGVTTEEVELPSVAELDSALERIQNWNSGFLNMEGQRQIMMIASSEGNFQVIVEDLDRGFFHKLTDRTGDGTIYFSEGGQGLDAPFRVVLNLEEIKAVAKEFFETGVVDLSQGWEYA